MLSTRSGLYLKGEHDRKLFALLLNWLNTQTKNCSRRRLTLSGHNPSTEGSQGRNSTQATAIEKCSWLAHRFRLTCPGKVPPHGWPSSQLMAIASQKKTKNLSQIGAQVGLSSSVVVPSSLMTLGCVKLTQLTQCWNVDDVDVVVIIVLRKFSSKPSTVRALYIGVPNAFWMFLTPLFSCLGYLCRSS